MNKKITCVFTLLLLTLAIGVHSASATAPATPTTFADYKIVGSMGSETEKTVFDLNDTTSSPYLYMVMPLKGQAFTGTFWRSPEADLFYTPTSGTEIKRWVPLADWKKIGDWEVNSNYFYNNGDTGFAKATFTVTPEPLAMILFAVGGLPIAARLYKRKSLTNA